MAGLGFLKSMTDKPEKVFLIKKEMTQIFRDDGTVVPVTVLGLEEDQDSVLEAGVKVDLRGRSKGKGFMGVVKRYSFAGAPKTRGTKHTLRRPGSIGAGTDPGRVWKGKKMAGRHAHRNVTVKNLEVVRVDAERGEVYVKGAVPGGRGSRLEVRRIRKE